jgi:Protein of unknown function (Porph_ging).
MKQLRLLTMLILLFPLNVIAQKSQGVDIAQYKCFYNFEQISDTAEMKYYEEELLVLQIGDKFTKSYSYKDHIADSLSALPNRQELMAQLMKEQGVAGVRSIHRGFFPSSVYRNYKEEKMTITDKIFVDNFYFEDELSPQDWKILEEVTTILDYPCQKAICSFRGRNYEAWFAPDIPVSEGPWKFYGLPGLIMKINDTQHHYKFEIIGFQQTNEAIEMKILRNYIKTNRKDFIRGLVREKGGGSNTTQTITTENVGLNNLGSEKSDLLWDYIERDYK